MKKNAYHFYKTQYFTYVHIYIAFYAFKTINLYLFFSGILVVDIAPCESDRLLS